MSTNIVTKRKLQRSAPQPMQLEQRFMFDGAAAADVINEATKHAPDQTSAGSLAVQPIAIEAPALYKTDINDPVLQNAITAAG